MTIGFIGCGNMAQALIAGALSKGVLNPSEIIASAPDQAQLDQAADRFGITVTTDNRQVVNRCETVVLAVKPHIIAPVVEELSDAAWDEKLIISIAAGKTIAWLESLFTSSIALVRAMPNTPALVGAGVTGLCANEQVSEEQFKYAQSLFEAVGGIYALPESLIDVIGAEAGSVPAFVFTFIEALADGAVAEGMPRAQAIEIAARTVAGSAQLVLESKTPTSALKDMVTSPGGTTIEGIRVLEQYSLRAAVMDALRACVEKSKRL